MPGGAGFSWFEVVLDTTPPAVTWGVAEPIQFTAGQSTTVPYSLAAPEPVSAWLVLPDGSRLAPTSMTATQLVFDVPASVPGGSTQPRVVIADDVANESSRAATIDGAAPPPAPPAPVPGTFGSPPPPRRVEREHRLPGRVSTPREREHRLPGVREPAPAYAARLRDDEDLIALLFL